MIHLAFLQIILMVPILYATAIYPTSANTYICPDNTQCTGMYDVTTTLKFSEEK